MELAVQRVEVQVMDGMTLVEHETEMEAEWNQEAKRRTLDEPRGTERGPNKEAAASVDVVVGDCNFVAEVVEVEE